MPRPKGAPFPIGVRGLVGGGAAILLLVVFRRALAVLAAAFALAYVLDPPVTHLSRRLPRWAASLLVILASGATLLGMVALLVPVLVEEESRLVQALPGVLESIKGLEPWAEQALGRPLPRTIEEMIDTLTGNLRTLIPPAMGGAGALALWIGSAFSSVVGAVLAAVFVPLLGFYLLKDFDRLGPAGMAWVPEGRRPGVRRVGAAVDRVLGSFVRGQIVVSSLLALLYTLGITLLGVSNAIFLGIFLGFSYFVPYVGPATGFLLAEAAVLLQFGIDRHALLFPAWAALVHLTESTILTPRILGGRLGLPPAVVVAAIYAGGRAFGFTGVLLAVPTAAVVHVLLEELHDRDAGAS